MGSLTRTQAALADHIEAAPVDSQMLVRRLRAVALRFEALNQPFSAGQATEWADTVEADPFWASLYRHWTAQLEERADRFEGRQP